MAPLARLLLLAGLCLAPGAPASAHPHVLVEAALVVQATDRGITELKLVWSFDEMFSSMVINDHDRNRDGRLQPDEVKTLKAKAFDNLRHYNYFLRVQADGAPFKPTDVAAFDARIVNGHLVYLFTVRLPKPAAALELVQFDPEFFVAFTSNEAYPVQVDSASAGRATCERVAGETVDTGYGSVSPDRLICRAAGR